MKDEQIIELFWLRSEQALSETKDSYQSYCETICSNILSNKQDVEECVSDAYLKLWDTIPPQKPRSLKAYLAKIVRNLSLDRYRIARAKKRGSGQTELVFDEICEFMTAGGEQIVDELALREAINSFLTGLDKQTRIIFVQRYWYFCPVKEIAQRYSLSQSKVKMTLKRTREQLKEHLEKEGLDL